MKKRLRSGRFAVSHDTTGNLGRISNCQLGRRREVKGYLGNPPPTSNDNHT